MYLIQNNRKNIKGMYKGRKEGRTEQNNTNQNKTKQNKNKLK